MSIPAIAPYPMPAEHELPANTAGTLALPFPEGARLTRDGAPGEPDRVVLHNGIRCAAFDLGSGAYGFAVEAG